MRPIPALCTLAAFCLAAACAPPEEAGSETAAATSGQAGEAARTAERTILELSRTWSDKVGEKDTVWIAALHAEDARALPPNAEPVVGRDAVAAFWGELVRTEGLEISWEPSSAHVSAGGDMAYEFGTYDMTLPDGSTDEGKYLVVWVEEDGEWKVAADMFSSNLPAPSGSS